MRGAQPTWWHGTRGEWLVVAQIILIAVVFFGPRTVASLPVWPPAFARISIFAGAALMFAGSCFLLAGLVSLGPHLTSLPYPRRRAALVQTGPYRLVRHPMYAGGIALAYGWALVVHGWLTLVYASALVIFLEIKSAREEHWLTDRFPEYPDYQRRVRKLIPFIH